MSRRAIVYGVVAVVLLFGVGAWISVNGKPTQPAALSAATAVLTVSVVQAEQKTLDDKIQVVGVTTPREDVVVIPELTGLRIQDIYAEVGDYVKKGQKLALLDRASLQIQLQGLRTEYERTHDEYQNLSAMQSSGAVSREALTQRRAAYEVARAKWQDADLSVQRTLIVAPTDGLVYERQAAIGGLTNGSAPLFRLARNGEVEAEAAVPEAMVRRVQPAMAVSLKIAGNPAPVLGAVRLITPRVDPNSHATGVRISFQRDGFTPVGVFCEASITLAQVGGWVLPGTALQQDVRGMFVWAVTTQQNVTREPVSVIIRTPESVVVREVLGSRPIVAKAGSFLKEGDLVTVLQDRSR
jgi:HlyD family secretion protein